MLKPFKSRKALAAELGITPKTLSNYMKTLGINWGKALMPPAIWEKVLRDLQYEEQPAGVRKPPTGP